jgi:hypothetical protein
MTAEQDDAKPIISGDYGSAKPRDVAGLHHGDAHAGRSHIPLRTGAKRRIKEI